MKLRARRLAILGGCALTSIAMLTSTTSLAAPGGASSVTEETTFLVVAKEGAADKQVRADIERAGGTVGDVNEAIGLYEVTTTDGGFAAEAREARAVEGVTRNSTVGKAPAFENRAGIDERMAVERAAAAATLNAASSDTESTRDPLDDKLWGMDMMDVWKTHDRGIKGKGVRVGVMDTGVDASHPDIAPVFDHELSRNFTTDVPELDGPCEEEKDKSCEDANDVDEGGHGTHVAGTIAAAANGRGVTGVAPEVTLVNLRVGQDSGYFFLKNTLDALTYAGQNHIDVVNMSYYIDPWAFYCDSAPEDSAEERAEQAAAIIAVNRATDYAHRRGVTMLSASGNSHVDMDNPVEDSSSPNIPADSAHDRTLNRSCMNLPTEARHVLGVGSVGPDGNRAYYSNFGFDAVRFTAPGGAYSAGYDTDSYRTPQNLILSTVPRDVAVEELRAAGKFDEETGESSDPFTVSECTNGIESCAYYSYYQGTSMASPHAAGAAALVIDRFGTTYWSGLRDLHPDVVKAKLERGARPVACPESDPYSPDLPESYHNLPCKGSKYYNTWYGKGILDVNRSTR